MRKANKSKKVIRHESVEKSLLNFSSRSLWPKSVAPTKVQVGQRFPCINPIQMTLCFSGTTSSLPGKEKSLKRIIGCGCWLVRRIRTSRQPFWRSRRACKRRPRGLRRTRTIRTISCNKSSLCRWTERHTWRTLTRICDQKNGKRHKRTPQDTNTCTRTQNRNTPKKNRVKRERKSSGYEYVARAM